MKEITKEQIQKVHEVVEQKLENIDNWSIEEVEEPIFVDQIEEGEIEKENFYEAVTEMGLPYIKKGRIPFDEFKPIATTILEFLKTSTNPQIDTKNVLAMETDKGLEKINGRIEKSSKIRDKDKKSTIERNIKIHDEIISLKEAGVKVNKNLMWSLYKIMRGQKRLERFEEDGQDIELLKLQNSFIDNETIDLLKEMRSEYYED